jgi:hypothetical protein
MALIFEMRTPAAGKKKGIAANCNPFDLLVPKRGLEPPPGNPD